MAYYCNNATGICVSEATLEQELCAGLVNGTDCEPAFVDDAVIALFIVIVCGLIGAVVLLGYRLHSVLKRIRISTEDLEDLTYDL